MVLAVNSFLSMFSSAGIFDWVCATELRQEFTEEYLLER